MEPDEAATFSIIIYVQINMLFITISIVDELLQVWFLDYNSKIKIFYKTIVHIENFLDMVLAFIKRHERTGGLIFILNLGWFESVMIR